MDYWIALDSLPPEGLSLTLDDQAIWEEPLREFNLACAIAVPLRAEVFLFPAQGGCLARGRLTGSVVLPCDRCAEDVPAVIDHGFESFEPVPGAGPIPGAENEADDQDAAVVRVGAQGAQINPAALVWEEFSLALPMHPLCREDCAGLCPECGKNLNAGACGCGRDQADPRLAALRALVVPPVSPDR
jgi:uncharacterized protein